MPHGFSKSISLDNFKLFSNFELALAKAKEIKICKNTINKVINLI